MPLEQTHVFTCGDGGLGRYWKGGYIMRTAIIGCGYVRTFIYAISPGIQISRSWVPTMKITRNGTVSARTFQCQSTRHSKARSPIREPKWCSISPILAVILRVSSAAVLAGKHVYTEKPLGMTLAEAQKLVAMAAEHDVRIGTAPCNMLSDTIQELWRAVRRGAVGKVRVVYANYDAGMIARTTPPGTGSRNRDHTGRPRMNSRLDAPMSTPAIS